MHKKFFSSWQKRFKIGAVLTIAITLVEMTIYCGTCMPPQDGTKGLSVSLNSPFQFKGQEWTLPFSICVQERSHQAVFRYVVHRRDICQITSVYLPRRGINTFSLRLLCSWRTIRKTKHNNIALGNSLSPVTACVAGCKLNCWTNYIRK